MCVGGADARTILLVGKGEEVGPCDSSPTNACPYCLSSNGIAPRHEQEAAAWDAVWALPDQFPVNALRNVAIEEVGGSVTCGIKSMIGGRKGWATFFLLRLCLVVRV